MVHDGEITTSSIGGVPGLTQRALQAMPTVLAIGVVGLMVLAPPGLRVIFAEYPGYGPRAGALGEASFVADAEQTVALAHRQYGGPLLMVGESLGAAVAVAAAVANPQQRELSAGLLLITQWDRLAHVGAHHYPWLPLSMIAAPPTPALREPYGAWA